MLLVEVSGRVARVERQLTAGLAAISASARPQITGVRRVDALRARIRCDGGLRFPHRKILDCLLRARDWSTGVFQEVHFSRLVKEARVGKNRAGTYLELLRGKGYLVERRDGYRRWLKIQDRSTELKLSPPVTKRGH